MFMEEDEMRNVHNMGGDPADEPIKVRDRQLMDWELKTYGVVGAFGDKGLLSSDELRRCIESLPLEEYRAPSYFEHRKLFSGTQVFVFERPEGIA